MAATFMPWGKQRISVGASLTRQWAAANGNGTQLSGVGNLYTWGFPGTLSKLYQRVVVNDRGASTIRVRKNGVDGNELLSIGASGTGEFEDNVNTDAVVNGDEVDIELITGAGGTNFIASAGAIKFDATSNTAIRYQCHDQNVLSTASTTFFFPLAGGATVATATESEITTEMETPGTLKFFGVRVGANSRSDSTEFGLRINGVDTTLKITVTAAATGTFLDTTSTDAIAVGDDVCFYVRLGAGTGSINIQAGMWVDLETTNSKWQVIAGTSGGVADTAFAASTTSFLAVGGVITNDYTTESEASVEPQVGFTASMLQVRVTANTVTATSTLKLRKNGADTVCSITIPASTTGLFVDTINSASVDADDDICYQLITGGTGTSLNISIVSMLCATTALAAPRFGRVARPFGGFRVRR